MDRVSHDSHTDSDGSKEPDDDSTAETTLSVPYAPPPPPCTHTPSETTAAAVSRAPVTQVLAGGPHGEEAAGARCAGRPCVVPWLHAGHGRAPVGAQGG